MEETKTTNGELIKSSATITADPTTGMRRIIKDTPEVNITKDDIVNLYDNGSSISEMIEKKVLSENGISGEVAVMSRLIRGMKDGSNPKPKFKQLPESIQEIIKKSANTTNPRLLQEFTNIFMAEQLKDLDEEMSHQNFTFEDIESGDSKPYSEMIAEQEDLFNTIKEDKPELYEVYKDASNFETIEKMSESKLPKLNKKYKRLDYYIKYYNMIYSSKRVSTSVLDVSHIPVILERNMKINNKSYDDKVYQYFLLIYVYYIYENSLNSDRIEDHIFISISTKSVFDLDYLNITDNIYIKRIEILSKILDNIEKNYL